MEWLILGIVILLTIINVPIGFALSISAIILLTWKGTAPLSIVPLNSTDRHERSERVE